MPQTGTQTTIKVSPSGLTPTYNETIVVLESPNIQSDNFKWLIDIYKGVPSDSDYELLSSIVILPNPDGYGVIDFHRHIENYITTDFYPADKDKVISRISGSGLKWSFAVTEQFENPKWRFDDNTTNVGPNVGFSTDKSLNVNYSNDQHPFVTGDIVSIIQDPGFSHPEYNTSATTLTYNNEYQVITDIPKEGSTPIEGGIMTLVSGGTRTIEQVFTTNETTIYSFNGALSFQGFRNWVAADYNMNSTSPITTKFLSDIPRTYNVTLEDRVWINGLQNDISNPPILGYITTDNGTYGVNNQYNAIGQTFLVQNKIGPKDLMETTDTTLVALTGSLPVVDANTTFITYHQSVMPIPSAVSESITLNIVENCSKYESIRFFYLDKLGSYLPLTFNKLSRTNVSNERKNYRQNYGTYDSVSNSWGYTTYDRGTTTYDIVSSEKVTCNSDWLTEDAVSMVVNMLNSPIVYIQDENGDYVAITITTNSYEVKKTINDKLLNYTLTFEYAQTNTNQRG
tara:strand:- start:2695 stop:4230 length:1536 start_codon:yes stop_codon:yes gene_type:complete